MPRAAGAGEAGTPWPTRLKALTKKRAFSPNRVRHGVEPKQDFDSYFAPLQTAAEGAEHLVGSEPTAPKARTVPP